MPLFYLDSDFLVFNSEINFSNLIFVSSKSSSLSGSSKITIFPSTL